MTPLLFWLVASLARADAIDGPPEDCARGSLGDSSHDGSWCAPTECTVVADCAQWETSWGTRRDLICAPLGLCVAEETYVPAGRIEVEERTPRVRRVARGACSTDADCAGAHCEIVPRCAQPTLPEMIRQRSGCGCRVGTRSAPRSLLLVALLFAIVRRRQASRAAA